jgi:RNA polymerase sigma-70 factor (ECF subfamily)
MSKPPTLPPDSTALLQQLADASRHVTGWLRGLGVPPEDQDDLAQDVTKEALENIGTYDPAKGEIGAWLHGITEKIVARYHEKRIRRGNITLPADERPPVASPEKLIVGTELDHVVRQVLASLDALDRQIVMERFYLERSYREIGETHGLAEDAARKRVERALSLVEHALRLRGIDDARRGVLPLPFFRREITPDQSVCPASTAPPTPPPSSVRSGAGRWFERAAAAGLILYLLLRPAPPRPPQSPPPRCRGSRRPPSAPRRPQLRPHQPPGRALASPTIRARKKGTCCGKPWSPPSARTARRPRKRTAPIRRRETSGPSMQSSAPSSSPPSRTASHLQIDRGAVDFLSGSGHSRGSI